MQKATRIRSFLPKSISIITLGLITALTGYNAAAIDVVTDPVGFYKLTCETNADTIVSFPFTRVPEYAGLIQSISGNAITVTNASFTANQFVYLGVAGQSNTYYAFIASGTKEGAYYSITNNSSNVLLTQGQEDLSSVAPGDKIQIIPYWTFGTAFPDGQGLLPSAAAGIASQRSQVLMPDINGSGINKSPTTIYYFFTNAVTRTWRISGSTTPKNEDVLLPDQYVIVRNNTGVWTSVQTTVLQPGGVPLKAQRTLIVRNAAGGTARDNLVALPRPAYITLNNSGLTNNGVFRPSAAAGIASQRDQLLVDTGTQGQNRAPADIYYFFTNATVSVWRLSGSTNDRGTNQVFRPGTGVYHRVNTNSLAVSQTSVIWSHTAAPTY